MRLVHLSDLHAASARSGVPAWPDKRSFGALNHLLRRRGRHRWQRVTQAVARIAALAPDLVLLSGDLTTLGTPDEFALAREALAPLVADRRWELLYVPGNHDRYVGDATCREALAATFRELSRDRWALDRLPLAHEVAGVRVLLVDETVPTAPWSSHGRLAPATVSWLEAQLTSVKGPRQVLLHHFPVATAAGRPLGWRRACRHQQIIARALAEGRLDLACAGHIHEPFLRQDPGGGVELCAGSLTATGVFALVDYDLRANRLRLTWETVPDHA